MEWTNWTETQVMRATRNSLIWNGFSLAAWLMLVWLLSDYLFWFCSGPAAVTDTQLLDLIDQNRQRALIGYVELKNRILLPTDWQEVSTRDGKPYSTVPYFLMPTGERHLILVMAKSATDAGHLIGPLSEARDIDLRVLARITQKHPELKDRIVPVVLNHVATFTVFGYALLVILIPWGAYASWNLVRAALARIHPSQHPIERQFCRWGDGPALVDRFNDEIRRDTALRFGKAILTDSWIARPTVFGATCVFLDEIVWAYALHRSTENFAVLQQRTGRTTAIFLSSSDSTALISALATRAPWIVLGFDQQRLKVWLKNRAEIVEMSDQRRADA